MTATSRTLICFALVGTIWSLVWSRMGLPAMYSARLHVWRQQDNAHRAKPMGATRATPPDATIKRPRYSSIFVPGTDQLKENADENGTVLDFAVIGYPKCGTTTMIANLGHVTPVMTGDVCTPVHNAVYYAYNNWPKEMGGPGKVMKGVKCPMIIDGFPPAQSFSQFLPRAGLIVGVRHPVLWFQSFYNMLVKNNRNFKKPYELVVPPCLRSRGCGRGGCPLKFNFCLNRAKFHLGLARLGKTALDEEERKLLPRELGEPQRIRNRVFFYEINQLGDDNVTRKDQFWDDVARFIGYPHRIEHDIYSGRGKKFNNKTISRKLNICDAEYDALRSMLMPFAWNMSMWICKYFVGKGEDVHVSSKEYLCEIISSYSQDPCGRLIRQSNGTYIVDDRILANYTSDKRP